MEANWSCLSPRILKEVADRVACLGDRLCFAAVCRSWRAAILKNDRPRTYPPYLILFGQEQEGHRSNRYGGGIRQFWLTDFSSKKDRHGLRLPPELIGWSPFGACHSWLGLMDQSSASACLLDPFTGDVVWLPPMVDDPLCAGPSSLEPWFPLKLCLSSPDPGADAGCFAVVIRSRTRRLAYAVPGCDGNWVTLNHPDIKGYDDVVYDDEFFYAISADGVVVATHVITGSGSGGGSHDEPRLGDVWILLRLVFSRIDGRLFLAVHPDGNLVVVSIKDDYRGPAARNQVTGVSKINMVFGREEVIQNLGDCTLFLGCSCSLSIPASQVEGFRFIKSVIYVATDCWVPRNASATGVLVQTFAWGNNYRRWIWGERKPGSFLIPPMWIAPKLRQVAQDRFSSTVMEAHLR